MSFSNLTSSDKDAFFALLDELSVPVPVPDYLPRPDL